MAAGDNEDNSVRGNIKEFKAWLARLETMNAKELMEYGKANKDMFSSEMRAAFKKLLQQKKQQPPKKKNKRTGFGAILGAMLKFHKDDDDDDGDGNPPGGAPIAC
ncbi:hypothetical protein CFC21_083236 [Triticum aestivum]|uniref:Uncharacterized protein n=3 Tax=Triticum TaxID=4564 RepID=A0A3B5XUF4_WHEAT|nr:uncharacterized protein LOC119356281 [Triticum dicoccoides]XP_044358793.1 uncharacterized protein LOC123079979 [Triticum aestivum]KAF6982092.1 hypothetical protein CFC21_000527 [Triticum aestivum]KAF6982094.1 hypothetical protein CFC21_000529 [Triticum aestivum]KAF7078886.1 hypothetical protein CFC21_083236 [Triticum aestivum]